VKIGMEEQCVVMQNERKGQKYITGKGKGCRKWLRWEAMNKDPEYSRKEEKGCRKDSKVGLMWIHPTSYDQMAKKRDKQKILNNFPTATFIKNLFLHKGRLVHLKHLCSNGILITVVFKELFKKLHRISYCVT
jgi:hypothetical protein